MWMLSPAIQKLATTTGKLDFFISWITKVLASSAYLLMRYTIYNNVFFCSRASTSTSVLDFIVISGAKSFIPCAATRLMVCPYTLCCSVVHAGAVTNKGQSCCNDQDISPWKIKTAHYFLVLQNICLGIQGLQGIQPPICKGRGKKKSQESLVIVYGSALKSTAGKVKR